MPGWFSPDGHVDGVWYSEALAYDGNTGITAFCQTADAGEWMELTFSTPVPDVDYVACRSRRFNTSSPYDDQNLSYTIELYYNGGWHQVYSGTPPKNSWRYHAFTRLTYDVSKLRIKCNTLPDNYQGHIWEIKIGHSPIASPVIEISPENEATEVPVQAGTGLFWGIFTRADEAEIILDKSNPPTTIMHTEPNIEGAITCDWIPPLDYGESYFWFVRLRNEVSDDTGLGDQDTPIYEFQTAYPAFRVYRGQDGQISYDDVVAEMESDDSQVTIPNQALPPNTIWHYVRRAVSHCGLESDDSPHCVVIIDADGEMLGNTPNPPLQLTIEPLADAKFKLRWRYTPITEEIAPTGFRIYMTDTGEFDFGTPQATVAYGDGGWGEFSWTSDELIDETTYRFCVRSYREDGAESQNTNYVAATADSTGPDAITDLHATWEEL